MVGLNFKTVKCKFKDICKSDIDYVSFNDAIKRADRLSKLCCLFIRSYLLFLFNTNKVIPIITSNFIRMAFRTLTLSNDGRPPDAVNLQISKRLNTYYNNEFKVKLNIKDEIDASNLSYILGPINDEILISIENNIKYHFAKHLNKFINVSFKINLNDKLSKKEQTNNTEKEIKSKHYSDLNKVKNDLLNNTDDCPIEYKKWIKTNKKNLIPQNLSFYEIVKNEPTLFIKPMFYINRYLEQKEEKTFQAFPIKTNIYTNYIKINSSALVDLFVTENKLKTFTDISNLKNDLWKKYFDVNNIKLKGYTFNCEIETDGYAVSLNFINNNDLVKQKNTNELKKHKKREINEIKAKLDEEEMKEYLQDKKEEQLKKNKKNVQINKLKKQKEKEAFLKLSKEKQDEILLAQSLLEEFPYIEQMVHNKLQLKMLQDNEKNKKIVCADPGKRSILYFIGDNKNVQIKPDKDIDYQLSNYKFMNYTNKERIVALKRTKYGKLIENKKLKTKIQKKTMKEIELELAEFNSKSCIYDNFIKYVVKKREVTNKLYKAYDDEYFRKLKWFSYINKRRHEDELLNKIEEEFGKDIILIIGNWGNHCNLKFISTPNIGIKRKLQERFYVFLLDEFNTSKIHYKHEVECENMKYEIKEVSKTKTIRFKDKKTKKRIKKIVNRKVKKSKIELTSKVTTKKVDTKKVDTKKVDTKKVDTKKVDTKKVDTKKVDTKKINIIEDKKSRRLHSVLTFKLENNVMGCINRDKNACMNFKKIVHSLITTKQRPLKFQRGTKTDRPERAKLLGAEKVHIDKCQPKKTLTTIPLIGSTKKGHKLLN
jgi:hypothetical protein